MGASVAEILLAQGQRAAEARRRMGEIQAGMWRDVGQIAGNTIQNIGQHYADAPARADAAKLRGLQIQGAEQQVDAGQREVEAIEQGKRRDAAFQGLFEMYSDGNIPEREVLSIYGPQAGEKVFGALGAFADLRANRVKDAQQTAARLAMGLRELAPDTQAQFWGPVREAAIQGGLGKHDDIPEQFSPEYIHPQVQSCLLSALCVNDRRPHDFAVLRNLSRSHLNHGPANLQTEPTRPGVMRCCASCARISRRLRKRN